jgi:hypothetical protein
LAKTLKTATIGKRLAASLLILGVVLTGLNAFAAQQLTLTWDPQSDTDVQGYGVYYTQGAAGPPYDLYGYVAKQELTTPDGPSFTVTNLQQGATYRFAVTAYTSQGTESGFSNQACAQVGDVIVPCAPSSSSASGSDGGGGGGGCFIRTASAGALADHWLPAAGALAMLLAGVFGVNRRR